MTTANDFAKGVRLDEAKRMKAQNPWEGHPDHPWEDWQAEVAASSTWLGYWEWVYNRIEMEE